MTLNCFTSYLSNHETQTASYSQTTFNAWLKSQKKDAEAYKLKCYINNLARKLDNYTTELIEYEEKFIA